MPSFAQVVRFNPYERPIEFSEFEAKYGIVSPDNLGMDRVSFRESFKGNTVHGSMHERVCEALLKEFIDFMAGVNTKEALRSARHKSVPAQHPYMMRNQDSEMAKSRALGLD
jgi:hypothetical protein